jgi:hypothetical protein
MVTTNVLMENGYMRRWMGVFITQYPPNLIIVSHRTAGNPPRCLVLYFPPPTVLGMLQENLVNLAKLMPSRKNLSLNRGKKARLIRSGPKLNVLAQPMRTDVIEAIRLMNSLHRRP